MNTTDPYEQKLYHMFTSHDIDTKGSLDRDALIKLCRSLELKDRSHILIQYLLDGNNDQNIRRQRITFTEFKEGLLHLLGGSDMDDYNNDDDKLLVNHSVSTSSSSSNGGGGTRNVTAGVGNVDNPDEDANDIETRQLVVSSTNQNNSPSREVSPKYIVGSKKYGRRSRPQSIAFDSSQSSASDNDGGGSSTDDSDNEQIDRQLTTRNDKDRLSKIKKVQRSSSHSDIHGTKRRRPLTGTKLKRCASLPGQKPKIEEKQKQLQTTAQLESSVESLGNLDFDNLSQNLYEIWNSFGKTINSNNINNIEDSTECYYLNQTELEKVCAHVGLHKIAHKVADEVFEKLGLHPDNRINFNDFISLIQNDTTTTPPITTAITSTSTMATTSDNNIRTTYLSSQQTTSIIDPIIPNTTITLLNHNNNSINSINNNNNNNMLSLTKDQISSSTSHDLHVNSVDWPAESSAVPSDVIIEMWETAGIVDATNLLDSLGFHSKEIHISQLSLVIDDELQSSNIRQHPITTGTDEEQSTVSLLRASLALHKAEVNALQQAFRQLAAQNRKLHADNREANRRASLLAQENDDRHANLESTARSEISLLEQRHTEILRDLTAQYTNDREHWSNLNSKLENRLKLMEKEETKLKSKIQSLQNDNSALETEQISLQKQVTELLETNIQLNNEIVEIDEQHLRSHSTKTDEQTEEVIELMDKISALQIENSNLRDKNDELISEVEELNVKLCKLSTKLKLTNKIIDNSDDTDCDVDSVTNISINSNNNNNNINDVECLSAVAANTLGAIKRRGDSPSKAKISEESPRLGKLRKCNNDLSNNNNNNINSEGESETSGDWLALNSELKQSSMRNSVNYNLNNNTNKDLEIKELREKVDKLQTELNEINKSDESVTVTTSDKNADTQLKPTSDADNDTEKLKTTIKELELSLEQMRKEYEDCEDYWQGKLNEERQLYEEEQRISDEKFKDLINKMTEYDEQFAAANETDGRLSPIEEKYQLEVQYTELETELEEIKMNARKMLEKQSDEIKELQQRLQDFQNCYNINNSDGILNSALSSKSQITQPLASIAPPQQQQQQSQEVNSPASSPISYLWHQSTIQTPARDYQNPNWNNINNNNTNVQNGDGNDGTGDSGRYVNNENQIIKLISPIQRPISPAVTTIISKGKKTDELSSDSSSIRSYDTHSVASTHSIHRSIPEPQVSSSPNGLREEINHLKSFAVQLKETISDLTHQRDCLVMELQQLQEVKPVLEKAYARTVHPSLNQRIQQLEQKNRHLQNCLRQQQQYTESILHQSWQQQRNEIIELHNRIEAQGILITEQTQRLANADLLVKDLYVENSQLSAAIQRLEQQRSRNTMLLQHQGLNSSGLSSGGLSTGGLP